ncbi:Pyridine nucleotide-disulphide oxidoreductase [Geodermatophilus siccatus]|uniref:Pyridine nucleotide-disulphide oxidoreductase n=1 Tax=Geodermatophilus siccatus TaxID=1137991 RepID=A0A1G9QAV8_9ACTN|nr:FAD-dependent oxidoreductase [Geodermatophilus siccatus]SDM07841.1 Pyridine nucleotide-disulphide oxidoreductase [Geodermatophilus siccatus]
MSRDVEVVVIGAGQAGLSAAHHLARLGLDLVVLDAEERAGGAWQHRWPSLTLARTHHVHDLPGLPFPPAGDDVPAADAVPAYFAEYERHFALPVHRPVRVRAVRRAPDDSRREHRSELCARGADRGAESGRRAWPDDRFRVETSDGDWTADAVVNATGTWTRPFVPRYPGQELFRGRQLTPVDYRGAAEFAGQSVVVVGGGASAVQLLGEIAEVADTTWVTRRPPVWREAPFGPDEGRAAVALVEDAVREGRSPGSVVGVTGLVVTPWVREARARSVLARLPVFDRFTPDGVAWDDGRFVRADAVLWATGFRAALGHLAPLGLRGPGGGIRMEGTHVAGEPRVHLVGYGPSASTVGANRAGREAAVALRRLLRPEAALPRSA